MPRTVEIFPVFFFIKPAVPSPRFLMNLHLSINLTALLVLLSSATAFQLLLHTLNTLQHAPCSTCGTGCVSNTSPLSQWRTVWTIPQWDLFYSVLLSDWFYLLIQLRLFAPLTTSSHFSLALMCLALSLRAEVHFQHFPLSLWRTMTLYRSDAPFLCCCDLPHRQMCKYYSFEHHRNLTSSDQTSWLSFSFSVTPLYSSFHLVPPHMIHLVPDLG